MDELFLRAAQGVLEERKAKQPPQEEEQGLMDSASSALGAAGDFVGRGLQQTRATLGSVSTGALKSVFELNDFAHEAMGDPVKPEEWSGFRKTIEDQDKFYSELYAPAAVVSDISQFATGMVGAGKLLGWSKTAQALKEGSLIARAAYETTRGAVAGYFAMDPHEERLSNLIQQYPALENPVSEFLSAKPDDSFAEGRLKNALEGIGIDVAAVGIFGTALKAIRYARNGDQEAAKKVIEEMATPEATQVVTELEKPKVRVPAGSSKAPAEVPTEKPRVRVKAGRDGEMPPGKAADDVSVVDSVVRSEASDLPSPTKIKDVPPKEIQPEELATILRGTDFDLRAIDQAGTIEEASSQGHKFADGGSLPWQKINTPEEASVLVNNAVQTLRPELDKMKGGDVLSDAKVEAMVRRVVRYYNEDPSAIIGEIVKAGKDAIPMVRNMEAGYLVSNKMFLDAYDVVNKVRWGNLDEFGGDRAAAIAEAKRRLELAVQTFGATQSIRSNVGRTMRRMRSEFKVDPKQLEALRGLDDEKFVELMATTGGDPRKMKELAKPSLYNKIIDEASFSMRNGLLWLYPTHVINLTGNVFLQVARPLEKQIGAALLGSKASPIRKQAAKEYYYTVASISDGWKAGVEAFMKGDSTLAPHMTDWLDTNGATQTAHKALSWPKFRQVNDFTDLWHNLHLASLYRNVTGLPTRALGSQDEFFKTLRYRAVVQARAASQAEAMGIQGQQLKDYVEDRLGKAFDADGKALDREALLEAQTVTFNQELIPGTLGATIRNARGRHPTMGLVLPFVKTPINVLRYAHKYTPVLNMVQKEYREALLGKVGVEQQAQAVGQMALGSLFAASALTLAASGRITGGGPADGKLKSQLIATGWKPYSVKIENDDGSTSYVPFGRLDPPGLVMGIIADLHHLYEVDPENRSYGDLATATTIALAKNFSERTFLLNMNQMIDALSDPENKMEKFLGNTAAATIPMSSAMRGYVNQDPYLRDARNLLDRVLKDVPGFSETIPPKRTVFGDPVTRKIGVSTTSKLDTVDAEHNRMMIETGEGLSLPSAVHNGVDLRDVTLTDGKNAYDLYQEYASQPSEKSPTLRETLAKLIESEAYQDMGDGDAATRGTRLNAMSGVVQKFRSAAYKRLLSEYPEIGKMTLQKRAEAAATYLNNRTGEGLGDNLLKRLGY